MTAPAQPGVPAGCAAGPAPRGVPGGRPPGQAQPSFDEFYACTAARLIRHGYALTGDMAEAQDIAQEAFARAWQRWAAVRECDSPEAWVRRVATNLAASRWRRVRVARAAAWRPADLQVPEVSTDLVALVSGLRTLPERHRTVLVLHYLCDLTVDQIASELRCPTGSVKSWLSRGRTALAEAVRVIEPVEAVAAPSVPVQAPPVPAAAEAAPRSPAHPVRADSPAAPQVTGARRLRPMAPWPARAEPALQPAAEASHV